MRSSKIYLNLALVILTLALVSCSRTPSYPETSASGNEIRLSLEALEDSRPAFFSFHHEGTSINYFVLRTGQRVESYFDACAKCSPKKLGYRVSGDHLVCVACGKRYPLADLRGIGSCYPIPLRGRVDDGSYLIEIADIVKGSKYF